MLAESPIQCSRSNLPGGMASPNIDEMTPPTVMDDTIMQPYDVLEAPELTDLNHWIIFLTKNENMSPDEYIRFLFTVCCVQHEVVWAQSPLFSHHLKMAMVQAFEAISTDFFIVEVVKASQSYIKLAKQDNKYLAKISQLVPSITLGHHQYWISGKKNKPKKGHNCYCSAKQCISGDTCILKRFPDFACTLDYWVIDDSNVHNIDNCKMLCQYCYSNLFSRPIEKIKDGLNFVPTLTVSEQLRWQPVSVFTGFCQLPRCCNPECSFAPDYRESITCYVQPFSQTVRSHMICPACHNAGHQNKNLSQFDLLLNDCESCENTAVKAQASFRKICDDLMKNRMC